MEKKMATLSEAFMSIEDPRNPSGRRHSLFSIFNLLTAGLLSGCNSLKRIVLWGRSLPPKSKESLGFKDKIPSVATLSYFLRRIPVQSVEKALGTYFSTDTRSQHLALDGKTLRASTQDTVPTVHLLSLFMTKNQSVINQIKMEKGENEISAAIRFLNEAEIEDTIITGDAIFAQKKSAKPL
jgi:hypothetical protein